MSFFSFSSNFLSCICCFVLVCLTKLAASQDDCRHTFPNGSVIDLTSLGYHNDPRWKNIKPVLPANFTYSYSPCFKFSIGKCENVNVCQISANKEEYYNCGNKIFFDGNGNNGTTFARYTTVEDRETTVTLICSPADVVPRLNVTGEVSTKKYSMTLFSRCACADLCRENHLSTGSVLVILLMIGVSLYLILGIIHSSLTRGAHGWELIPHHEFWADFPLLVKDGCVFVMSGCKPETAYERI
ncbi:uncharacterized protein CEXT_201571 [Caerostris extrusa]|uniref:MRH domain-containing protein n=1 Tax=Caerostris extrusa TaxID=172846 RepID=A0AAV4MTV6_CAEEX|nr:uncharacterized protein CEXT_201571 [Caerostris extrusa]